jgi:hypothetical protein
MAYIGNNVNSEEIRKMNLLFTRPAGLIGLLFVCLENIAIFEES